MLLTEYCAANPARPVDPGAEHALADRDFSPWLDLDQEPVGMSGCTLGEKLLDYHPVGAEGAPFALPPRTPCRIQLRLVDTDGAERTVAAARVLAAAYADGAVPDPAPCLVLGVDGGRMRVIDSGVLPEDYEPAEIVERLDRSARGADVLMRDEDRWPEVGLYRRRGRVVGAFFTAGYGDGGYPLVTLRAPDGTVAGFQITFAGPEA